MPNASDSSSTRLTADLAAGLYVGAVGSLAVAFLPQMIVAARSSPDFVGSTGDLAAFASADTTGMLIGGLLLLYGVRRWNWRRTAAVAAIALALLNAATPLLLQGSGVTLVLATRLLTGTCGGLLLGLGLACMHAYARRELV
jgi:peptidoglycan/LPS O-acetylase OafA/YrhL